MLTLVRSFGKAERGSTEPLLFADTSGHVWLVKLAPAPMLDHVAEVLAAELATRARIAIPEVRVAEIPTEFDRALSRAAVLERRLAAHLATFGHLVFASRWLDGAIDVTEPPVNRDDTLARILALDLLLDNHDRRADHPNLLQAGNRLLAMDHAQAVPWCRRQVPSDSLLPDHVARARGLSPAPLGLTEQDVRDAVAALPPAWLGADTRADLVEGLSDRLQWLEHQR